MKQFHFSFTKLISMLSLFIVLSAAQISLSFAAPDADFNSALWVAEDNGVLKVTTSNGNVLFEIANIGRVDSVVTDGERGRLWVATQTGVHVYNFAGQQLLTTPTPFTVTTQEADDIMMVIDEAEGSVWLTNELELIKLDSNATVVFKQTNIDDVETLSFDSVNHRVWLAHEDAVTSIDAATGAELSSFSNPYNDELDADVIHYDEALNELWLLEDDQLTRYDINGNQTFNSSITQLDNFLLDGLGNIWGNDEGALYYLSSDDTVLFYVIPFTGENNEIEHMVVNPSDNSVWVANNFNIVNYKANGLEQHRLTSTHKINGLAIYSDIYAPTIVTVSPVNNTYINTSTPILIIKISDKGVGVDPNTIELISNGQIIPSTCTFDEITKLANCFPNQQLVDKSWNISARVKDYIGNQSEPVNLNFTVDTIAPVIKVLSPENNLVTNIAQHTLSGQLSEKAALTSNDNTIPLAADYSFTQVLNLVEGNNSFIFNAVDKASNVATVQINVQLDTIPPVPPVERLISYSEVISNEVTVTGQPGSVEPNSIVVIKNQRTGVLTYVSADAIGGFTVKLASQYGDILIVSVKDKAGNVSTSLQKVLLQDYGNKTGYITGTIYDFKSKLALTNVQVSIKGLNTSTVTDSSGHYTITVPNRGVWTLFFETKGYIEVRRDIYARPGSDVTTGKIGLQSWDTNVVTINAALGGSFTDSTGNVQVDFPPGALPSDTSIRASYLKTKDSFPLPLPNNMVYVGGVQMGPEHIEFNQPVTVRVRNTLNFPPGDEVPYFFASHDPHDLNEGLYDPGVGTVTADGQFIEYQVNHFSCMALGKPAPQKKGKGTSEGNETSENENSCSSSGVSGSSTVDYCDGKLTLAHQLPPLYAFGQNDAPVLSYNSKVASPAPYISANIDMAGFYSSTAPAAATHAQLNIEGQSIDFYLKPSGQVLPLHFQWNRKNVRGEILPTGSYPFEFVVNNLFTDYQGTTLNEPYSNEVKIPGRVMLNDQSTSAFGAGWGLAELERLHRNPDGTLLLTRGNGDATVFNPIVSKSFSLNASSFTLLTNGLNNPQSIAPAPDGGLYVSEFSTGAITHIALNGTKTLIASGISSIKGIAVDSNGLIFAGTTYGSIYRVTPGGVPEVFVSIGTFDHIDDLAIDANNNVYVLDGGFGSIHKITPAGELSYFYNGLANGLGTGVLNNSMSMSFDKSGNLYVTNNYNNYGEARCGVSYISKFDKLGNHSYFYVGLNAPRGISADKDGNMIVADYDCNKSGVYTIKMITPLGEMIPVIENIAGSIDAFGLSYDLLLQNNNLYFVRPEGDIYTSEQPSIPDLDSTNYALFTARGAEFSEIQQDLQGNLVRVERNGTRYVYSKEGLHIETHLPQGRFWKYEYDVEQRLIARSNAAGHRWQFNYNGKYLSEIVDPAARHITFTIDASGNLVHVNEPENTSMTYQYDDSHRIISKSGSRGFPTSYQYGVLGNIQQVEAPTGEIRKFSSGKVQRSVSYQQAENSSLTNLIDLKPLEPVVDVFTNGRGILTKRKTNRYGSLTSSIDGLGNPTSIIRNNLNQISEITYPDGNKEARIYNNDNLLKRTILPGNLTTSYSYDDQYRLDGVISTISPKLSIDYDANNNITRIVKGGSSGAIIALMTYNPYGQLLTQTIDNKVTSYKYDVSGRLTNITNPAGEVTYFEYDSAGNRTLIRDALNQNTRFMYDGMGRLLSITDTAGLVTKFSYLSACATCGTGEYLLESITDANLNTTRFEYNKIGQLLSEIDPVGNVKAYTYDFNRNLTKIITPNTQAINFEYDANDRLIKKFLPNDVVNYQYDVIGNLLKVSDNDSQNSYVYDQAYRTTKITTGGINQAAVTLNQNYYVYTRTRLDINSGINSRSISYGIDSLLRTGSIDIANNSFGISYDNSGRRSQLTHNSEVTNYQYDAASRLLSLSDSAYKSTLEYGYDLLGRRISDKQTISTAPVLTATLSRKNITSTVLPVSGQVTGGTATVTVNNLPIAIDANGQLQGEISLNQGFQVLEVLATDSTGKQTSTRRYVDVSVASANLNVNKIFDVAPNGDIYFQDSTSGLITAVIRNGVVEKPTWLTPASDVAVDSQGNVYNLNGNILWMYNGTENVQVSDLTSLTAIYDMEVGVDNAVYISASNFIYRIDNNGIPVLHTTLPVGVNQGLNQPVMESSSWGLVVGGSNGSFYRIAADGTFTLTHTFLTNNGEFALSPDGVICVPGEGLFCRTVDDLDWPHSTYGTILEFSHDGVLYLSNGNDLFYFDSVNNIDVSAVTTTSTVQATLAIDVDVLFTQNTKGYTYDSRSKLASVTNDGQPAENYLYDNVGNRTLDNNGSNFTYNTLNEIINANGVLYTYDANGNRNSKTDLSGTTAYQWDSENQLIRIDFPDTSYVTYAYDPLGRRIQKQLTTSDGVTTTRQYAYSGEDIILEQDEQGNIISEFTHGPGIDEPLSLHRNGKTYIYHADALGSIIAITDELGSVVQRYKYDAYGNITNQQDPAFHQPYTYTGREWDAESGLYYYRARYYDAEIGRFISKDPIGFAGGDTSLYGYVLQNPINWIDPLGLWQYANEYGTNGNGLTGNINSIEGTVDQTYNNSGGTGESTITFSTNGSHSPNSLHYSGNAIDLRVWGLTPEQVQNWTDLLQNELGNNYDVINEGDHVHCEYDPQ